MLVGGTIDFVPDIANTYLGIKGSFVTDPDGHSWIVDVDGKVMPMGATGSGTSFKTIIDKDASFGCSSDLDVFAHYKVDTTINSVTATLPLSTDVEDGFRVEFNRTGGKPFSVVPQGSDKVNNLSLFSISNHAYYEFTLVGNKWEITSKEVDAIQGSVTHFVGFWVDDGGMLCVDIMAMSDSSIDIDTSKYTLTYDDGTPAWSIVAGAVDLKKVSGSSIQFTVN